MGNRQAERLEMISYGKSDEFYRKNTRQAADRRRAERKRKRRRKVLIARFFCAFSICMLMGLIGFGVYNVVFEKAGQEETENSVESFAEKIFRKGNNWTAEDMFEKLSQEGILTTQDFLTPNEYSRPGDSLNRVKNIFVHYTANPGTSAAQNKSYFEGLAQSGETSASSHFIIGYEGEVVQCVPLDEIAYAVAGRNEDSISIECCYINENGEFTQETYTTLVHFSALLLEKYGLEAKDLRRHYDEGGKLCPKYYAENEEEWEKFVEDVAVYKNSL